MDEEDIEGSGRSGGVSRVEAAVAAACVALLYAGFVAFVLLHV